MVPSGSLAGPNFFNHFNPQIPNIIQLHSITISPEPSVPHFCLGIFAPQPWLRGPRARRGRRSCQLLSVVPTTRELPGFGRGQLDGQTMKCAAASRNLRFKCLDILQSCAFNSSESQTTIIIPQVIILMVFQHVPTPSHGKHVSQAFKKHGQLAQLRSVEGSFQLFFRVVHGPQESIITMLKR